MERELWLRLRGLVDEVYKDSMRRPGVQFSDRLILLVYAWAVAHDRPTCWACTPAHWPAGLRPFRLPSQPTMSRRLRAPGLRRLLEAVTSRLRGDEPTRGGDEPTGGGDGGPRPDASDRRWGLVKAIDGKPLPVGGFSKDPDAACGYGAGRFYKGYKLYALWGLGPLPMAWEVLPADVAEPIEAERLLPRLRGYGYLDADAAYDDSGLYDLAMEHGHQLLAPRKRPGTGLGHCYQSEWRLRAIGLLEAKPGEEPAPPTGLSALRLLEAPIGRRIYARRAAIERRFGNLTSPGGGLSPLPPWVRRLPRVKLWVEMKIILNGLRTDPSLELTA